MFEYYQASYSLYSFTMQCIDCLRLLTHCTQSHKRCNCKANLRTNEEVCPSSPMTNWSALLILTFPYFLVAKLKVKSLAKAWVESLRFYRRACGPTWGCPCCRWPSLPSSGPLTPWCMRGKQIYCRVALFIEDFFIIFIIAIINVGLF